MTDLIPTDRVLAVRYVHSYNDASTKPYGLRAEIDSTFDFRTVDSTFRTRDERKAALLREIARWEGQRVDCRIS